MSRVRVMAEVELALTDEFLTARQIWGRVGRWSPHTIRHRLAELVRAGKAEKIKKPYEGDSMICFYRRPQK